MFEITPISPVVGISAILVTTTQQLYNGSRCLQCVDPSILVAFSRGGPAKVMLSGPLYRAAQLSMLTSYMKNEELDKNTYDRNL